MRAKREGRCSPKELEAIRNQKPHWAATKIQSSFRAYLARKAGVVKLQALIRGWGVRKQAIDTLKRLHSILNIQPTQFQRQKDIKMDLNNRKKWDNGAPTKEELKEQFITASIKREGGREYYLNHRRSAETEREKVYGSPRYRLDQWVDTRLNMNNSPRNLDKTLLTNARSREKVTSNRIINSRHFPKQDHMLDYPTYVSRRSYHHKKQQSIKDNHSLIASPAIPTYMASTESTKAKARSLSSPRLRSLSFDMSSEIISPYKHKLSLISSINSELISSTWVEQHYTSLSQRSPRLKGMNGSISSTLTTKDTRLYEINYKNREATNHRGE